jgi:hypothetical protein
VFLSRGLSRVHSSFICSLYFFHCFSFPFSTFSIFLFDFCVYGVYGCCDGIVISWVFSLY